MLEAAGDARGQALAHYELARAYGAPLNFAAAGSHLEAALALWPVDQADTDCIRILLLASETLTYAGDHAAASAHLARASALAERLGDPGLQGEAVLHEVVSRVVRGAPSDALHSLYARAEALLAAGDRLRALCLLHIIRGNHPFLQYGDLRNAEREYARAAGLAEGRLSKSSLRAATDNLYEVQIQLGRWEDARRTYRWARALLLQLDPEWQDAYFSTEPWWLLGEPQRELVECQRLIEHARQQANLDGQIGYAALLAQRYLALGRAAEAEAPAREAVAIMRRFGSWGYAIWTVPPLAEALVCTGAPDAVAFLAEAFDLADRLDAKGLLPQLLRARGLLLFRQGDLGGALTALRASAGVAREQHALLQLGATLSALADVAQAADDPATALEADIERLAIIERIGPEVRSLIWAK